MVQRVLWPALMAVLMLVWGCSEGRVAPVPGGDADPDTPGNTDTWGQSGVDTFGAGTDTQGGGTDTNGVGTCSEGLQRCSVVGHVESCASGQWVLTQVCDQGCVAGACEAAASSGSCATPLPLTLGQAVIGTTDTTQTLGVWLPACTQRLGYPTLGPETVYELNLTAATNVRFKLTPIDQAYFGLYIRGSCTDAGSQLHSACEANDYPGGLLELVTLVPAGKTFIFVDDFNDADFPPGRFSLLAEATGVAPCGAGIPEILDPSSGSATAVGNTNTSINSESWLQVHCPADQLDSTGPEVVYTFALRARSTIQLSVTPRNPADSMLGVYIRTKCNDFSSQVACGYTGGTVPATINAQLDPGQYYLFVDDFPGSIDDPQEFLLQLTAP